MGLTLGISAFTPLIIVLTASRVTRVIPIRGTWEADIRKLSRKASWEAEIHNIVINTYCYDIKVGTFEVGDR